MSARYLQKLKKSGAILSKRYGRNCRKWVQGDWGDPKAWCFGREDIFVQTRVSLGRDFVGFFPAIFFLISELIRVFKTLLEPHSSFRICTFLFFFSFYLDGYHVNKGLICQFLWKSQGGPLGFPIGPLLNWDPRSSILFNYINIVIWLKSIYKCP